MHVLSSNFPLATQPRSKGGHVLLGRGACSCSQTVWRKSVLNRALINTERCKRLINKSPRLYFTGRVRLSALHTSPCLLQLQTMWQGVYGSKWQVHTSDKWGSIKFPYFPSPQVCSTENSSMHEVKNSRRRKWKFKMISSKMEPEPIHVYRSRHFCARAGTENEKRLHNVLSNWKQSKTKNIFCFGSLVKQSCFVPSVLTW